MARVPVVLIGDILVATVQEDLYDRDALHLQTELTDRIEQTDARGVLIDLSTVETVDSYLARLISEITAVSRLMGAQTVVVGMRPPVALTLVELGLTMQGVRLALDANKGYALLRRLIINDDRMQRRRDARG